MNKTKHHGTTRSPGFFSADEFIDITVLSGESGPDENLQPDVGLQIWSGPTCFSFNITPSAARELASRLLIAAHAAPVQRAAFAGTERLPSMYAEPEES